MEYWIWNIGQEEKTGARRAATLHHFKPVFTYAASAARQSRIGAKPSSSETKQRSGV
jgi:hypothetical protein